ncbi:MAG: S8 family serine peptidase [Candidatus Schekmanbacteria bacterium]|nr:S8 family serine peptidase [Candidatus Schekmanbacteria bacterium]
MTRSRTHTTDSDLASLANLGPRHPLVVIAAAMLLGALTICAAAPAAASDRRIIAQLRPVDGAPTVPAGARLGAEARWAQSLAERLPGTHAARPLATDLAQLERRFSGPVADGMALTSPPLRRLARTVVIELDPFVQADAYLATLKTRADVAWAELDGNVRALTAVRTPNDPSFVTQWGLSNDGSAGSLDVDVDGPEAWSSSVGDPDIIIAILDSGLDLDDPEFAGRLVLVPAADAVNGDDDPSDDAGHGTAVAAVAAAAGDNGVGIAGMCWRCSILPIKVLDSEGIGSYATIADSIQVAAAAGARVINLSVGGTTSSEAIAAAVDAVTALGVLVVAAAGNESTTAPVYPAALPSALAVGAIDRNGQTASFSNHGSWVDLGAPGEDITTLLPDGAVASWRGTSLATAFVSGAAALVLATHPDWNGNEVQQHLRRTAKSLDAGGPISTIVSAGHALSADTTAEARVAGHRIDDAAQGSGDGRIDPGETFSLYVTVSADYASLGPLSGTLSVLNQAASLDQGIASWPAIPSGRAAENVTPFVLTVPGTISGAWDIELEVALSSGEQSLGTAAITLDIAGGKELPATEFCEDTTLEATAYLVRSTITVCPGATLTLPPGSSLHVLPREPRGTPSEIQVFGTLMAVGTADKKIGFSASSSAPQPGDWGPIRFLSTSSPSSVIQHAEIRYGTGIAIQSAGPTIADTKLRDNTETIAGDTDSFARLERLDVVQPMSSTVSGGPDSLLSDSIVVGGFVDVGTIEGGTHIWDCAGVRATNLRGKSEVRSCGDDATAFRLDAETIEQATVRANRGPTYASTVTESMIAQNKEGLFVSSGAVTNSLIFGNGGFGITGAPVIIDSVIAQSTLGGVDCRGDCTATGSIIDNAGTNRYAVRAGADPGVTLDFGSNYWGVGQTSQMDLLGADANMTGIWDDRDESGLARVGYSGWLPEAPELVSSPGYVQSVTLDPASPVSSGVVTFAIQFSLAMDRTVMPAITFGSQSPFDTYAVVDGEATWTTVANVDDHLEARFAFSSAIPNGTYRIAISDAEDSLGRGLADHRYTTFTLDAPIGIARGIAVGFGSFRAGPQGAAASVCWQRDSDADIAGFRLRWGESPEQLGNEVDTGLATLHTVTGLEWGRDYFFAVQTYDAEGSGGGLSEIVKASAPPRVPLFGDGAGLLALLVGGGAPLVRARRR